MIDPKTPPQGTLRDWIDMRAIAGGIGFTFPEGAPDLTWEELRDTSKAIAENLTSQGVKAGESVAIVLPNGREALNCLFGVLYGGFRATMINLVAGTDAISYALGHSDARFAFVGSAQKALFDEAAGSEAIQVVDPNQWAGAAVDLHKVTAQSHALLMYTSGTTGRPKGVVHTQSSLLAGGWSTAIAHQLSNQDRGFCVLPIYHINGLCVSVMSSLVSGGSLAICSKFSASAFWANIGKSHATWFSVVPTIISHLLHSDTEPDDEMRTRLRFGRSASAPLSPDVHRAFEARFNVPIIETMGLTETAAQILSNPLPPGICKIGSPGIPFGNEVTVLNTDLAEAIRGEEGELAVRGPNVLLEYLKNEEATFSTFTPDGWMRTGDLARQDKDGYVFITGRLKELIIKGGENIAPRGIDDALYSHPDVLEAAAFARPCKVYGERVEAAVALKEGSSLNEEALSDLCISVVGKFKAPDKVHLMNELPKGPSGKVQRLKLAEMT